MNIRCFLRNNLLAGALLAASQILPADTPDTKNLPNIIYIMADDLGYGDLSCYGAEKIHTPHIDSLAEHGIRLTDAHTPSSVCTPTRYGVLTGRYCWRGRLKKEVLWSGYERCLIEKGRKTIGNMMQEKGYRTAQIGKWHLGWEDSEPVDYSKGHLGRGPRELGFDYSFVTASAQNLYPVVFVENHKIMSKLKPIEYDLYDHEQKRKLPASKIEWHKNHVPWPGCPMVVADDWQPYDVDKIYTEKATAFITQHVQGNPEQPFYLHLTPEAPHTPNIMPEFMRGTSQAGPRGDHVQMLDWMVGQIVQTVKKLKIDQNTLIVLTSDNGARWNSVQHDGRKDFGHKNNGNLRGYKTSLWDGGHRVPFVACWPGRIAPGTQSDMLICLTDMMATFAAITDYKLDKDMGEDSFNALPVLLGNEQPIRDSIIHHSIDGGFSIRKGPWKLVHRKLFNMKTDFQETHNVASAHPEMVKELKALLKSQKKANRTANN